MSEITSSFSSLAAFADLLHRYLVRFGPVLGSLDLKRFHLYRGSYLYLYGNAFVLALHMPESLALGFS